MCLGSDGAGQGGSVYVGHVIMANKGIITHLTLWPDDHRQNISEQGIECTYGIQCERQKVVVKSSGRNRKYTRIVLIFLVCL